MPFTTSLFNVSKILLPFVLIPRYCTTLLQYFAAYHCQCFGCQQPYSERKIVTKKSCRCPVYFGKYIKCCKYQYQRDYSFFTMTRQPPVGKGLLITETSRSHSDTPSLVELLWTSDQPDAEISTRQHTTIT